MSPIQSNPIQPHLRMGRDDRDTHTKQEQNTKHNSREVRFALPSKVQKCEFFSHPQYHQQRKEAMWRFHNTKKKETITPFLVVFASFRLSSGLYAVSLCEMIYTRNSITITIIPCPQRSIACLPALVFTLRDPSTHTHHISSFPIAINQPIIQSQSIPHMLPPLSERRRSGGRAQRARGGGRGPPTPLPGRRDRRGRGRGGREINPSLILLHPRRHRGRRLLPAPPLGEGELPFDIVEVQPGQQRQGAGVPWQLRLGDQGREGAVGDADQDFEELGEGEGWWGPVV